MDSSQTPVDAAKITGYHAHIYYDEASRAAAAWLREQIGANFTVQMGRWREEPVGPHPQSMYQVAFATTEFARIVPWLMINRRGLVILVHPNTGDAYTDHAVNPLWLGEKLALRLDFLRNLDD
jgi:aromatic ring-cleaving dioxygenase